MPTCSVRLKWICPRRATSRWCLHVAVEAGARNVIRTATGKSLSCYMSRAVYGFRALLALGGLSDEATDHVVAMVGPEGALLDALKTIDDQLILFCSRGVSENLSQRDRTCGLASYLPSEVLLTAGSGSKSRQGRVSQKPRRRPSAAP